MACNFTKHTEGKPANQQSISILVVWVAKQLHETAHRKRLFDGAMSKQFGRGGVQQSWRRLIFQRQMSDNTYLSRRRWKEQLIRNGLSKRIIIEPKIYFIQNDFFDVRLSFASCHPIQDQLPDRW